MLIFAAILAIFVYGMIAAMLGTILPELSEPFSSDARAERHHRLFPGSRSHASPRSASAHCSTRKATRSASILGLALIVIALLAAAANPAASAASSFCCSCSACGGGIVVTGANALVLRRQPRRIAPPRSTSSTSSSASADWPRPSSPPIFSSKIGIVSAIPSPPSPSSPSSSRPSPKCPRPPATPHSSSPASGPVLGRPLLLLSGLFLFLYVGCEVGVWNWLPRHLIAQGIPESKALNILSLGFALGLLIGRVAVSPILIHVPAADVTLASSIAMAITTFLMLRTNKPVAAAVLVFLAGLAMAPVFPTTLAIVGTAFPEMTGTAIGFAITCGWAGLAVSSRIIGVIAGPDPQRLKKALLLIPGSAVLMIGLNLAMQASLK